MVYFGFALFIFSLRGTSTISSPLAAVVSVRLCLLLPLDCNHRELQWSECKKKMFLSTKGLGAGGRFTQVDWAACSQDGVVRTSLSSPNLNSGFNLVSQEESHASPPQHLGLVTPQTPFKPGSTGYLHSKMGGPSTPSFHSSPFSLPQLGLCAPSVAQRARALPPCG